jgi:hypothetical protein
VYESNMPVKAEGRPLTFQFAGKALQGAAPAAGARFPLVVVSNGYPGWIGFQRRWAVGLEMYQERGRHQ